MWISDLLNALKILDTYYGYECCVARIQSNYVTLTNGDTWYIKSGGTDIERVVD